MSAFEIILAASMLAYAFYLIVMRFFNEDYGEKGAIFTGIATAGFGVVECFLYLK